MSAASADPFDYEGVLRACAAERLDALRQLYEHEADRLFGVALRIVRRRDLAEDIVHECFLQVWRKAETFDPQRGNGRAWLSTIVRNRALNVLRDGGRIESLPDGALDAVPDVADDPARAFERIDDAARLKRCLAGLDDMKRTSILLAYVDGFSRSEIAGRLGAPENTVKAWIRRGLLALRECLQ
jgi:RNA polymerase sigma-70 factor (ECF subfamily)